MPNYVVQLRPTAPLNKASAVDAAVRHLMAHELMDYDSLRSVTPYDHEAYNSYWLRPDGSTLKPLIMHKDISPWRDLPSEPQSVARQILPNIYWHNAYIDIVRSVPPPSASPVTPRQYPPVPSTRAVQHQIVFLCSLAVLQAVGCPGIEVDARESLPFLHDGRQ